MQGDGGGYYYILPSGELYQWTSSFEESIRLAELDEQFYDNSELLVSAEPVDANVSTLATSPGPSISIDPCDEFVGTFSVRVMAATNGFSMDQTFDVTVQNSARTLGDIDDVSLITGGQTVEISLPGSDADNDELTYSVSVLENLAYELVAEHGLNTNGNFGLNWGGQQEKWLSGDTGQGWFFLLPDGSLNQWKGSFENSIPLAQLGTDYYDDPMQLIDAQPLAMEYSIADNVLTITSGSQTGTFNFTVTASDGTEVADSVFDVSVAASVLEIDVENQSIESGSAVVVSLPTINPENGLAITYEFSIVDPLFDLDQEHGFYSTGDFYTDYLGNNERWIRNASAEWHYLLPNDDLYRWEGNFATSTLLAELGSEVYDDPTQLTDAQPLPATIEYINGQLTVTPAANFVGQLELRITATDGTATTTATMLIDVTESLGQVDSPSSNGATSPRFSRDMQLWMETPTGLCNKLFIERSWGLFHFSCH